MALSYEQSLGDGSNRDFTIPFGYINKEHVQVTVDGGPVAFTWTNPSLVQLATAPAAGALVTRRRSSNPGARLVDFTDGSTLIEADLDLTATQALYLSQEAQDAVDLEKARSVAGEASALAQANAFATTWALRKEADTGSAAWDGQGRRLKSIATPQSPTDAANAQYVDEVRDSALRKDSDPGNNWLGQGRRLKLIADPQAPSDAANKQSVDAAVLAGNNSVKAYADAGDVTTLAAAKSYTDAASLYAASGDAAFNAAKIYTDTKVPVWTPENFTGTTLQKIQAAVDAAYNLGGEVVLKTLYTGLTGAVKMRPDVTVRAIKGGGLQGSGVTLVEFNTYVAHRAVLKDCIVDGGWVPGAALSFDLLIHNMVATGIRVEGCKIRNTGGTGLYLQGTAVTDFVVQFNTFDNCAGYTMAVEQPSVVNTRGKFMFNRVTNPGQHGIIVWQADRCDVIGNTVEGALVTGYSVTIAGTAVTKVSGPNFTADMVGKFLISKGIGQESLITAVTSATQLTINVSRTEPVAIPASYGTGDLINLRSSSWCKIDGNRTNGGAGCGVVFWDYGVGSPVARGNRVDGNIIENVGSAGVSTQGYPALAIGTKITNNVIRNPGLNTTAGHVDFNVGIRLAQMPLSSFINGNDIIDDQATATMDYGICVKDGGYGETFTGRNRVVGAKNPGIRAAATVTLGAGWGTTGAASLIVSYGNEVEFSVTANGTGLASGGTCTIQVFTLALGDHVPTNPTCLLYDNNSGTATPLYFSAATATASTFMNFAFTPVAGRTYRIVVRLS
jgi:hypothetical protein